MLPCASIVTYPLAWPGGRMTDENVHARTGAEELLLQNQAILRMVLDNVPTQIAYYDAGTITCVFANEAYARANGKTVQWASGRHCRDIVGEAAWAVIEPQVTRALRGETINYERALQMSDGSQRHIEVDLVPHFSEVDAKGLPSGTQLGAFVLIHDITRRHQAEVALRDNEERLRKFAAATTEGVLFHRNGVIVDCNEAAANLVGAQREPLLGQHLLDYLPPSVHDKVRRDVADGVDVAYQTRLLRADGCELPVEITAREVRFNRENHRMVVIRNISEREELTASLASSEACYKALADNAYEAIFVAHKGVIRYVNPAAIRLFCRSQDDLIGLPSIQLVHPEDRAMVLEKRDAMIAGGQLEPYEARMISPPGDQMVAGETRSVWARIYGVRVNWDGDACLLVFIDNISEARELRERLRAALAQKDAMLATTAVGVCMLKNRRHQWVNDTLCQMLGYQAHELIGQETRIHFPGEEAFENVGRAAYADLAATGATSAEVQMMRRDGSLLWVQIDGRAMGSHAVDDDTVWTYVDITQRKLAEVEMRETLARERELGALKTGFVSMASHEFRTPLTTIQTSTDLLLHYADRLTEEDRVASLHDIQNAVNRMKMVMENMLMLGKLERSGHKPQPVTTAVHAFLRQIASEVASADGQQHVIELLPPAETWASQPLLDETLMRQILGNLLGNACKYSPKGSTVRVSWCRHAPGTRSGEIRPMLGFDVVDQGMGIPSEDIPRLFETFHRASNAGTIQGTGLGLAIVKRALDTLEGSIQVSSELGVGTRFSVRLPWYE